MFNCKMENNILEEQIKELLNNATKVLCHEEYTCLGLRFWGSPWNWAIKSNGTIRPGAPSSALNTRYTEIPSNIDVLLTHGAALGRLDSTGTNSKSPEPWGSRALLDVLMTSRPLLHLHGKYSIVYRGGGGGGGWRGNLSY